MEWSAWTIFAGLSLGTLLGVPAVPLYVAAGALWGVEGIPILALAMMIHLCGGYFFAKKLARPIAEKIVAKFHAQEKLSAFLKTGQRDALKMTLLVRLFPALPLCVKTYVLGLMEVPFWIYLGVSMLIEMGWAWGYSTVGGALWHGQWTLMSGAAAVIILLMLISKKYASGNTEPK